MTKFLPHPHFIPRRPPPPPPPPFRPPNHVPFTELEVSVLPFYFTCFSAILDLATDESACADSSSSWKFRLLSQQNSTLALFHSAHSAFIQR
ncbi:hypothetical protein AAHA92_03245 [Salvia divinorum]|uniref:Uncharacterized protein n=1 Tax=Salvia divinorum TaxID=28513 RepID=A0ABD1IGG3_SALDI